MDRLRCPAQAGIDWRWRKNLGDGNRWSHRSDLDFAGRWIYGPVRVTRCRPRCSGIVSASVSAPFSFPIPGSVPSGSPGVGVTTLAEMTATEVWLARFSVTLTGAAGDSLLLTADRLGTAGGIFNNGNTALGFPPTDLDGLAVFGNSAASETISLSVTSVPEPSSVLVVAMFAGLGCVREHRRRRTKANRK